MSPILDVDNSVVLGVPRLPFNLLLKIKRVGCGTSVDRTSASKPLSPVIPAIFSGEVSLGGDGPPLDVL